MEPILSERDIGKIEGLIKGINDSINKLEEGQKETLQEIKKMNERCFQHEGAITRLGEHVKEIETKNKFKIDGNIVLTVINSLALLWRQIIGK